MTTPRQPQPQQPLRLTRPLPNQGPPGPQQNAADSTPRTRRVQGEWLPTAGAGPRPRSDRADRRAQTVNKTRNGGGFNPSLNPSVSVNITKGGGGNTAGQGASLDGASAAGTPGAGFMSNEDIHKFSEFIRREARKRAGERAMDAEQLEQVLRNIPDSTGSMAGARLRARRVSRHLKRIAKAEQLVAKEAAALYSQFEREYEAELRKISAARPRQPRTQFGWR